MYIPQILLDTRDMTLCSKFGSKTWVETNLPCIFQDSNFNKWKYYLIATEQVWSLCFVRLLLRVVQEFPSKRSIWTELYNNNREDGNKNRKSKSNLKKYEILVRRKFIIDCGCLYQHYYIQFISKISPKMMSLSYLTCFQYSRCIVLKPRL